jgi:tetratricopeptide (TPR) repeat protein
MTKGNDPVQAVAEEADQKGDGGDQKAAPLEDQNVVIAELRELFRTADSFMVNKKWDEAAAEYMKCLDLLKRRVNGIGRLKDEASAYVHLSNAVFETGDNKTAIEWADRAIVTGLLSNNQACRAWRTKACANRHLFNFHSAVACFSMAIDADPEYYRHARWQKAECQMELLNYSAAIADYRSAKEVYLEFGMLDDAAECDERIAACSTELGATP